MLPRMIDSSVSRHDSWVHEYMCFHVNVANLTALTFSYALHADRPSNRTLKEESKFKL